MARRLFKGLHSSMDSKLTRPWWRALSLTANGWWHLALSVYAAAAVLGGLVYDEVILLIPSRKAEAIYWIASSRSTFYWSLMALYAAIALYCGHRFLGWLVRYSRRGMD